MTDPSPIVHRPSAGVQILGSGVALPEKILSNRDLETMMETSDDWIIKRTGIRERRVVDHENTTTADLATAAAERALAKSGLTGKDIDLVIVATMTADTPTPSVACEVSDRIGTNNAGAFDINAACSGFAYGLNLSHELIQSGAYKTILLLGADTITRYCRYDTYGRNTAVLFGDAAGAFVIQASEDNTKGVLAQAMHSDGGGAKHLFIPCSELHLPEGFEPDDRDYNMIQMNGQAVFKFAVKTFPELIQKTLDTAGLSADQIDHFVCHQSNSRILEAARDRFGVSPEKLHVNIERFGNTVGASVPLVFNELAENNRVEPGNLVMFLGFGAGLTWGSSLWRI